MPLTSKQEQFCREYLIDLNAKQAAIRTGYSEKTAEVQGSRLLSNAKVASRVAELKSERVQRVEITADYVLSGLKEVAERCLASKPVMVWDYANSCKAQKRDDDGNGVFEFDSSGANRALELLGKHVGVFEKDNEQQTKSITVNIE